MERRTLVRRLWTGPAWVKTAPMLIVATRMCDLPYATVRPPPAPMPYSVRVHPAIRTATIFLTGTVNGKDIAGASREAFTHEDWEPGFCTLWDARAVRALVLLPGEIESVGGEVKDLSELRGPGRTAIVTADPSIRTDALLISLKSVGADEREARVFTRLDDAEDWLAY